MIGDVAQFQRHHAGEGFVVGCEGAVGEDFQRRALGVLERHHVRDPGSDVAAPLALDAGFFHSRGDCVEIASGRNLKRQPGRAGSGAALEHDSFES